MQYLLFLIKENMGEATSYLANKEMIKDGRVYTNVSYMSSRWEFWLKITKNDCGLNIHLKSVSGGTSIVKTILYRICLASLY